MNNVRILTIRNLTLFKFAKKEKVKLVYIWRFDVAGESGDIVNRVFGDYVKRNSQADIYVWKFDTVFETIYGIKRTICDFHEKQNIRGEDSNNIG